MVAMKFGTHIHGTQRMKPYNFGDLQTFHLALPSGQSHLSSDISQNLQDGLAAQNTHFIHTYMATYPYDFGGAVCFPLVPP